MKACRWRMGEEVVGNALDLGVVLELGTQITVLDGRKFGGSRHVVSQAMDEGVSLENGGKVRVTFTASTGIVNRIMDDE